MRHFGAETWYLFDFSFPPPCCRPSCPAKCARNVGGSAACPQTTTFREFKFHTNFLQTNPLEGHHKNLWPSWPLCRMTARIGEIVFPDFTLLDCRKFTRPRGGRPLGSAWPQYTIFIVADNFPLKVIPPRKVVIIATCNKIAVWVSEYPTIQVFTIRECDLVPGCCPEPYDLVFGAGADFARLARRYWDWNVCAPVWGRTTAVCQLLL